MRFFRTRYRRVDPSMAPCLQTASASPVSHPLGSLALMDVPHVDGGRQVPDRREGRADVAGRPLVLSGDVDDAPIMLTEFGGISFNVDSVDAAWGYSAATTPDDFAKHLRGVLDAVRSSSVLAGFCYTQLSDTLQETNGLVDADRNPKLPLDALRAAITGEA